MNISEYRERLSVGVSVCTRAPLLVENLEEILAWCESYRPKNREILITQAGRPLILTSQSSVLSFSDFENGDKKFPGDGACKRLCFGINLETAQVEVIGSCSQKKQKEFEIEVAAMQALKECSQIVRLDFSFIDTDAKRCCMIMEYCNGGDLFDAVVNERISSPGLQLKVARDIARGVAFMHENGWLHRDLKPENIFLIQDEKEKIAGAKVGDLGFACKENDQLQRKDQKGTCAYFPPERAVVWKNRGDLVPVTTKQVDAWALGVILYVLFTGEPLFDLENKNNEQICQIIASLNSEGIQKSLTFAKLPAKLQTLPILWELLQIDPEKRISAAETAERLDQIELNF